jgi:hypothetical protein
VTIRLLNITLPDDIHAALVALARSERRRPQDQAALIIAEAVARAGFLEIARPKRERAAK